MNEYEERAYKFLTRNKIYFRFECLGELPANWQPSGLCYQVSMKKFTPTNKQISFKFWDSKYNQENGIEPTAYDVLACLSSDITLIDPEEIISEGLTDSMKQARMIARFAARLQKFFTPSEQAELTEIQ